MSGCEHGCRRKQQLSGPSGPSEPAAQAGLRLHGACAAWRGTGVLLLGRAGSGKSDLLLRLIDRGFELVADDQVLIEDGCARPPDVLAGLIEVRGLGILRSPYLPSVALGLAVALDDAAMSAAAPSGEGQISGRLPCPIRHRILGLPLLRIEPFAASAVQRIEIALDCLGGRRVLMVGALPPAPSIA